MRSRIEALAFIALLTCGTFAFAQGGAAKDDKPPAPPAGEKAVPKTIDQMSLEEILALALKNNPDLRVAEAKLREAEAEYNRARLQLSQKVVMLRKSIEARKMAVIEAQKRYDRIKELYKHAAVSVDDVSEAEATVLRFKAELAELEAELPYLIGKLPQEADKTTVRDSAAELLSAVAEQSSRRTPKVPRGAEADKLRKALSTPIEFNLGDLHSLGDIADYFSPEGKNGVCLFINVKFSELPRIPTINFVGKIPVGAALQLLEDAMPGLRFTVRDYGILATYKSELPAGALSVHDFWKNDAGEEKPKTDGTGGKGDEVTRNSPPEKVEGVVKKVEKDDLVLISVGSDAGLAKGHTLELFRLEPKPIYLGTIRIIEVKATEAVGRLAAKPHEPVKEGDRVTNQSVGK